MVCFNRLVWKSYANIHQGRVDTLRVAGKKLFFADIEQEGHSLQIVCQSPEITAFTGLSAIEFQRFYHLLRRGDIVCEYSTSN